MTDETKERLKTTFVHLELEKKKIMKYYQVLVFGAEQFNNGEYEGMTKLQVVIHNSKISRSIDMYNFDSMDEAQEFAAQFDEIIGMGTSIQRIEEVMN